MGRKNKINRYETTIEEDHYEEDHQNKVENDQTPDEKMIDAWWSAREQMLEYTDQVALPLCEKLTVENMSKFVSFLMHKK